MYSRLLLLSHTASDGVVFVIVVASLDILRRGFFFLPGSKALALSSTAAGLVL